MQNAARRISLPILKNPRIQRNAVERQTAQNIRWPIFLAVCRARPLLYVDDTPVSHTFSRPSSSLGKRL